MVETMSLVPRASQETDGVPGQYLTFTLNGEMYSIAILNVKEIIEYGSVTEIPMLPDFIRGVINLRGSVVPVIDLSSRFGSLPTKVARRTCIVIIELLQEGDTRYDIGIIVDSVSEVLEIYSNDIEPAPNFGVKIRTDFIAGMGKVNGRFVIILDVARVLSIEELALLTQLTQEN